MPKEGIDDDEITWFAFHYEEEDGVWAAGIQFTNVPDHDQAVYLASVAEAAVRKALEGVDQTKH